MKYEPLTDKQMFKLLGYNIPDNMLRQLRESEKRHGRGGQKSKRVSGGDRKGEIRA